MTVGFDPGVCSALQSQHQQPFFTPTTPGGDQTGGVPGIDMPSQTSAGGAIDPVDEPSGSLDLQEGETVEGFENARVYEDDDGNTFYGFTDESGLDHLFSEREFDALQELDGFDPNATALLDGFRDGPGVGIGPAPEGDLTLVGPSEDVPGATVYEDASGDRFYSFTPPNADGAPGRSEVILGEGEMQLLQENLATPEGQALADQLGIGGSLA